MNRDVSGEAMPLAEPIIPRMIIYFENIYVLMIYLVKTMI
jgi:hypothetical protein